MAMRVLEETGLLPHLNPGVMTWEEMNRLKPVAPSMGMMLETTSRRLFETKGRGPLRLARQGPGRAAAGAGGRRPALRIPFTTGLLVGIGETLPNAPRRSSRCRQHAAYGAVQEVIVQNFRAKPDTAMRHADDLGLDEYRAAIAVTRLVLGPGAGAGASEPGRPRECGALLGAGVDDWGGVSPLTPDHVNPSGPGPRWSG